MFKTFKPVAGLALALVAGLANATDISFGNLSFKQASTSYDENSYLITPTLAVDLLGIKTGAGRALETSGFTFTADSGGDFDLKSLDLDDLGANSVKLTYTTEAGKTKSVTLTSGVSTFNYDDLVSFTLTGKGSSPEFLVDDIRVKADTAAAVPEPSSMALMFAGLGIFATLVRRRRV